MKTCPQCNKTYNDMFEICPDDRTRLASVASTPKKENLLERYKLLEKIGEGGMGAIYKAIHTEMDRTCAIKLLTAITAGNEEAAARFKREARMASRIDNPHAVTIYDFGETDDGTLFLAMEFIDGRQLTSLIKEQGALPLDRVVHITNQIAEGLTAAHAMGIVHRDLKPDNVMITRKGNDDCYVKVLDFGIAKTVADEGADGNLTKTGFVLGTPFYMSPEQLLGEKLDPRSDVYSLAIIVYEMLSGRLPFEGENPQSIMMKRIMGEPIPLHVAAPSISDEVEQVVMAGLAREREARTPTVEAFALALANAQRGVTQMIGSRSTGSLAEDKPKAGTQVWAGASTKSDSAPVQAGSTAPVQQASPLGMNQAKQTSGQSNIAAQSHVPTEKQPVQPVFQQQPVTAGQNVQAAGEIKRGSRAWIGAVAAIVVLVIIGAVAYFALGIGKKGSAPNAPVSKSGFTINVAGAPAGSEVFVNNESRGKVGNDGTLVVTGLDAGNLQLRISHEGYADFATNLAGEVGKEAKVEALLLPLEIDYNGSKMVLIPAGEFLMGDDDHKPNEKPAHKVSVDAFYIDKYEVTNAEFKKFWDETYKGEPYPKTAVAQDYIVNFPDKPAVGITFDWAKEFAQWAGKRLPTEAEWEKAASWDPKTNTKRIYPWGNNEAGGSPNIGREKVPVLAPGGAYPSDVSAYGVFDMAGNVQEWVDAFFQPYEGNEKLDSGFKDKSYGTGFRVARGSSISAGFEYARTTSRSAIPVHLDESDREYMLVGIRCAISANDPKIRQFLASRNK
ncbi:MAG TPA: bifunctional serine/threonine-protein kinase/formylglycine-generating enzyme family protein [Blastocatellia bacterium]|nr:bifunctional serine/threonine-protein kinase/formylglycine-generating enzyme family protein [Blastocatellia bacterium]